MERIIVDCKHDFKPLKQFKFFSFPRGYSKCTKCGILRHDEDGHLFFNPKEAREAVKKR